MSRLACTSSAFMASVNRWLCSNCDQVSSSCFVALWNLAYVSASMTCRTRAKTSESVPRALCIRSRRAPVMSDETVMKSITGATTGRIALPAAMNGACPMMRPPPMTAVETPSPMTISVLGLAVARKTLPAARDEAAVLPAAKSGCSQTLSITPPDSKRRPSSHEARRASLMSRPRSTTAIGGCPSDASTCPTGWRGGACGRATISVSASAEHRRGSSPGPIASTVSSSGENRRRNTCPSRCMSPARKDRILFLLSLIDAAVSPRLVARPDNRPQSSRATMTMLITTRLR